MCITKHITLTTLFLLRRRDIALLFWSTGSFSLYAQRTLVFSQEQSVQLATSKFLACEQALHLWDIVKRRRARGTREETPKRGAGRERRACNDRSPFLGPWQLRPLARVFSRGWLRSSKSRACSQASKLPSSPSLTTRHIIKCVLIVQLTHSDLENFRT